MITLVIAVLEAAIVMVCVVFAIAALRHAFYSIVALFSRTPASAGEPTTRFTLLIPAHDEEFGISGTIAGAQALDYPRDRLRIVVLADNCTDDTAEIARSLGVEALERRDPTRRGKGWALDWFVRSRNWEPDEALVCLDADSVIDPAYLRAVDGLLHTGAQAIQGFNGAKTPGSRLAALSMLTNTMKNAGTYAGRRALGMPVPLMNGWCLSGDVLRRYGWMSFSVAEDFEQTLRLGILGVFPQFAANVRVRSEKASTFRQAAGQRERWSGGQAHVARTLGWYAATKAIRSGSWPLWELAMDVLLPGYAVLAGVLGLSFAGSMACGLHAVWLVSALGLIFLTVSLLVGLIKVEHKSTVLGGLLLAPVFIVWKVVISAKARLRPPARWRRAMRDHEKDR